MRSTTSRAALATREDAAALLVAACQRYPSSPFARTMAETFPPVRDDKFFAELRLLDGMKP